MPKRSRLNRADPKALGQLLTRMWTEKASEIEETLKSEYGLAVFASLESPVSVQMHEAAAPIESTAELVKSIKLARRMLEATGSVENAIAILQAVNR
jgi:hypothetical protein